MPATFETWLTTDDIMEIFSYSRTTVYRRVAASRAGRGRFPLPIDDINGTAHRWNPADIRAYLNNTNPQQPIPESASSRQKRHRAACESLKQKGVKINDSNKK